MTWPRVVVQGPPGASIDAWERWEAANPDADGDCDIRPANGGAARADEPPGLAGDDCDAPAFASGGPVTHSGLARVNSDSLYPRAWFEGVPRTLADAPGVVVVHEAPEIETALRMPRGPIERRRGFVRLVQR